MRKKRKKFSYERTEVRHDCNCATSRKLGNSTDSKPYRSMTQMPLCKGKNVHSDLIYFNFGAILHLKAVSEIMTRSDINDYNINSSIVKKKKVIICSM